MLSTPDISSLPEQGGAPSAVDRAAKLPLRLQVPTLGEALRIARGAESDACALRLIEIAGYRSSALTDRTSGAVELIKGLSEAWRARHAPDAMLALARGWTSITPNIRPLALSLGRRAWIHAAKALAADPDPSARRAALSIARDTCDPGFGAIVCALLRDEDKDVRLSADRTLLHLAVRLLEDVPHELLGDELSTMLGHPIVRLHADEGVLELERCALIGEISDAAWAFASHRCRSPLFATLLLMDFPSPHPVAHRAQARMRRLLSERNHPSHAPIRSVLQRTECPLLRLDAWRMCTIDAMARPAAQRLERAESIVEHAAVLGSIHLALRPGRRRVLATLRKSPKHGVLMTRSAYASLRAQSRLGYLAWVSMLDLSTAESRAHIEPALSDPDPRIRLLGHERSDPIERTDYLFDADSRLARHAALSWSSVGAAPPSAASQSAIRRLDLSKTLGASRDAWVRRVAKEENARIRTDLPDSPASRAQARRLYASDPARFVRGVRAMLQDDATQLDALTLVLRLGVSKRFEMDLVAIARDANADPRVRATAVRGLGEIVGADAARAARACLEDDDPRLRANSLETPHVERDLLVELKEDPHHRVRSSALRKLLASRDPAPESRASLEALGAMLEDEREPHRIAGVWAAQRTIERDLFRESKRGVRPVLDRLGALSIGDPAPQVRSRARACLRRVQLGTSPQNGTDA